MPAARPSCQLPLALVPSSTGAPGTCDLASDAQASCGWCTVSTAERGAVACTLASVTHSAAWNWGNNCERRVVWRGRMPGRVPHGVVFNCAHWPSACVHAHMQASPHRTNTWVKSAGRRRLASSLAAAYRVRTDRRGSSRGLAIPWTTAQCCLCGKRACQAALRLGVV